MTAWSACEKGNNHKNLPEVPAALDLFRLTGARHFLPYWEAHHAVLRASVGDTDNAAKLLGQAFEKMNHSDECWCEAELHRYRGLLLEKQGAEPAKVEACYRQAIKLAQHRGAIAWELRATLNLARGLMLQGTKPQARQLVQSLHGRIPFDLDRESLAEAESLLACCT